MKTRELSPADIVGWFRHQAKVFNEMADAIESTFTVDGRPRDFPPTPTASEVRKTLAGKAMRLADLARILKVGPDELKPMLTEENGFVLGERGWIRAKKETPQGE